MQATLLRPAGAPVLRVGHRGAKGHAPENTLASFNKGVALGASVVETDVHLSKDGEVVLIHDHTVDRTTDGKGYVKDMTLAELKQLDAGAWYDPRYAGERIPTLAELLAWASDRVPLAIEIKNGPIYYSGIAEKTLRLLREYGMLGQAILISFDHLVLREAKMLAPEVATGLLYVGRLVDPVGAARAAGASALHPQWAFVTPDLVAQAHDAGLAVSPWCPNDLPTIQWLDRMGVDSIGSDYPDLFERLERGE
jgi:glycerophosphoryl diester phosphodiesterase